MENSPKTFCIQATPRFLMFQIEGCRQRGVPQDYVMRGDEPVDYDEAIEHIRSIKTELIPCEHAGPDGKCMGFARE